MQIDENVKLVDGRRVQVAERIPESRYGKEYTRLDAPHGYKKRIMTPWGAEEMCMIYVVKDISGMVERYATIARPKSDPLVAFKCFRLPS